MTSKEEIAGVVREVFESTLRVDPTRIENDTALRDDLNLDSLDLIEVVSELEDRFDVQIPEESIQNITTFAEVVDGLHAAISAKGG